MRGAGHDDIIPRLVLVHPRAAHGQHGPFLLHLGEIAVQSHLHVGTAHHAVVQFPVVALCAGEYLEGEALAGVGSHMNTEQGVVDAQGAFLIASEDESRPELFVEVSQGDIHLAQLALDPEVGDTPSLEVIVFILETWHGPLGEFEACPGIHPFAL